jgi:uncharacterized protein (DUF1499 family)
MKALLILAVVLVLVPLLLFAAGQFGLLRSSPPTDLGVKDGKLKPPSKTENSVSSQAAAWKDGEYASAYAQIEPLRVADNAEASMAKLKAIIASQSGARIVTERPDYLYVQFETRWMRFVDDAEFWFDPATKVVQVRSSSRLGRKDFGANRAHIEAIRTQVAAK